MTLFKHNPDPAPYQSEPNAGRFKGKALTRVDKAGKPIAPKTIEEASREETKGRLIGGTK